MAGYMVNRYRRAAASLRPGLEYDLKQAALLAVLRACRHYDPARGKASKLLCLVAGRELQLELGKNSKPEIRCSQWDDRRGEAIDVADPHEADDQDDQMDASELLPGSLTAISASEHRAIILRFGLDGHGKRPLAEVGRIVGLTKKRVRQILQRAPERMRQHVP